MSRFCEKCARWILFFCLHLHCQNVGLSSGEHLCFLPPFVCNFYEFYCFVWNDVWNINT